MKAQEKRIAFRCTSDEFDRIKDQAEDAGLNVTDYLKWLVVQDSEPIGGEVIDLKGGEQ